tara:strand:+ start:1822 stop:2613 length:792 start_codon:yes stop_codon:yes gene_type:complete
MDHSNQHSVSVNLILQKIKRMEIFETLKYFVAGCLIGTGLSWFIEIWSRSFILQFSNSYNEKNLVICKKNITPFSNWKFFLFFSIFSGLIANWRQFGPNYLSDLVLVTSLIIIAQIDLKTMCIEGRILTFALIVRMSWLLYFEPLEIVKYLSGLFFGAGLLYLVGFFYQTFRENQGLGDGDASVLGLIGFWLGWQDLGAVILIAALSGIFISGIHFLKKRKKNQKLSSLLKTKIAFAPFLCFAGLLVYFFKEINIFNLVLHLI